MSSQEFNPREAKQRKRKSQIDKICLILFWIALIGECYALYTKNYNLRFVTRTVMVPFLFLRIFNKDVFFSMHFFVYMSLLLTWFGDILNLIADFKIQYLASTAYTLSYLVFGVVFYNFKNKKKMFVNYIFYACFAVLGVIVFFIFYFPTMSDSLNNVHLAIHGIVLLFALFWAITIRKDIGSIGFKYFLPCIILMIITNALYYVDYNMINKLGTEQYDVKRNTIIDVVVAFIYGLYIFTFTQGIRFLKYAQKEILKEEAKQDVMLKED